ncbi:2Fe-2S iron-sulfur cluster binding domain-containing protein [Bradyrhizobium sp. 146]|nr:2Fe-2S iron-sulfur cluster binding domain-containing protein [Bradyrhizobium sp. 146]
MKLLSSHRSWRSSRPASANAKVFPAVMAHASESAEHLLAQGRGFDGWLSWPVSSVRPTCGAVSHISPGHFEINLSRETRAAVDRWLRVAEANRWFARSWVGRWARPLCFDIVRLPLSPGSRFLDALIDSGISLVEGGCGTCETRVIEGMPDHREQFLSKQEQETNKTIMICYSGAKSKKLTLDL